MGIRKQVWTSPHLHYPSAKPLRAAARLPTREIARAGLQGAQFCWTIASFNVADLHPRHSSAKCACVLSVRSERIVAVTAGDFSVAYPLTVHASHHKRLSLIRVRLDVVIGAPSLPSGLWSSHGIRPCHGGCRSLSFPSPCLSLSSGSALGTCLRVLTCFARSYTHRQVHPAGSGSTCIIHCSTTTLCSFC